VAFVAFILLELRQRLPMLDLSLFKSRGFAGANAVMLFLALAMFGVFFYVSLYVQQILGYSPVQAGAAFLPWIIVCVILLIWGTGAFKAFVNPFATWNYPVPELHNMINKVPPVAPRPQREPVNWSKLAEQAFAARTLAWAGGIATALGVALLFVLAASRGWVTPEMRVGLGVLVSLGLLGAAFDLDRRGWRADAILSAGGAGIAGLYATLWASISMYHFISEALGLPCAAAIAEMTIASSPSTTALPVSTAASACVCHS